MPLHKCKKTKSEKFYNIATVESSIDVVYEYFANIRKEREKQLRKEKQIKKLYSGFY